MSGGGGGGRDLTLQELQLIDAQTQGQFQQNFSNQNLFARAQEAGQRARALEIPLQNAVNLGVSRNDLIGNNAFSAGGARRAQEEALLRQDLGTAAQIQGLGAQIQGPDLSGIARIAQDRAQFLGGFQPPNIQALEQITAAGLRGANASPLDPSISLLQELGGSANPAAFEQSQLQGLGIPQGTSQLQGIAGQLSQIGQGPGVIQEGLTGGSIGALQEVLSGEVPGAVAGITTGANTAARDTLERQFNTARERLIESGVTGGALTRALAGLEGQRALGLASQVENREAEARQLSAGLLNQAVGAGLAAPAQQDALRLQGLGQAGAVAQGAGQLGVNQDAVRGQILSQAGQIGLRGLESQANILGQAGNIAAQQAGVQQGFLDSARLGASQLGTQALQFENQLGQALGLAGQLEQQQFAGQLAANEAQRQALLQGFGTNTDLAARFGAGADNLRFQTAPTLFGQNVALRQAAQNAPATTAATFQGGAINNADVSGALNAINNAANFRPPPSAIQQGIAGGVSGAGAGLAIGTALGGPGIGTAIGGAVGLLGGLL